MLLVVVVLLLFAVYPANSLAPLVTVNPEMSWLTGFSPELDAIMVLYVQSFKIVVTLWRDEDGGQMEGQIIAQVRRMMNQPQLRELNRFWPAAT